MRLVARFLVVFVVGLPFPVLGAPAPDLINKSLLLTWTENRMQRTDGSEVRGVAVGFDLRIYVSSSARPFTRLSTNSRRGSQSNEQVGGAGSSLGGGVRSVRADGHSIVLQATFGNFARNLRVEVAPGGGSCSAQMSIGKEPGSAPKPFRNTAGMLIEIQSMTTTTPTCSIQQGNVFGR